MANILVTGAAGQLGSELRRIGFTALDEVFYTDVAELDITSYEAIEKFVIEHEIDTIVNCAAYTDVDRAEDESKMAEKINKTAVSNLARVAYKQDCLLIHISTDYVFDGTGHEPYTEKSKTNPNSVYGVTKLEGEKAIYTSHCMYIIIRTAWLYSAFGNNFVKTIRKYAAERGELNVVSDQIGTPTYAGDLAQVIVRIVGDDTVVEKEGIYHFSNEGVCSWYDFAKEIVRLSDIKCEVHPVTAEQYPTKAKRPAYSVLDKTKIKKTFDIEIPDWRISLKKCIDVLSAD